MLVALLMMSFGGMLDIFKYKMVISKEHLWSDGIFLAIVALLIEQSAVDNILIL
jgi:hypothetical protein